jgi:hypothetical protein
VQSHRGMRMFKVRPFSVDSVQSITVLVLSGASCAVGEV